MQHVAHHDRVLYLESMACGCNLTGLQCAGATMTEDVMTDATTVGIAGRQVPQEFHMCL